MVNKENFEARLKDAHSILTFAGNSYLYVMRIYDLVQTNEEFFHTSPGTDKLQLAVLKLETLVDQWRHEQGKV